MLHCYLPSRAQSSNDETFGGAFGKVGVGESRSVHFLPFVSPFPRPLVSRALLPYPHTPERPYSVPFWPRLLDRAPSVYKFPLASVSLRRADYLHKRRAIALQLDVAYAGDLPKRLRRRRTVLYHGAQRGIVKDDVRWYLLRAGQFGAAIA